MLILNIQGIVVEYIAMRILLGKSLSFYRCFFKIGTKWFISLASGPRLIAASSPDGLNFRLGKTIQERGSKSNTIYIGNNLWRQFFCEGGIRSAVSSDGLI